MKFAAWYAFVVGLGMIALWNLSIVIGGVPEFQSEPWRVGFHRTAVLSTDIGFNLGGYVSAWLP
jgi:hypothetical protein